MPPARGVLYLFTFGVLAVAGRAALGKVPPLAVALALALAYVALVLSGVLVLRLRMFVDALTRGPKGARGVVLTFDDGPHPVHTRAVLDLLGRESARATFFVIGKKAEAHPDLVREILSRGHRVGLHSYEHDRFMALRSAAFVRADLERGMKALERITGERPTLFRPPVGHTNPSIARVVGELDLAVVGWTTSGLDGVASARPERVAARVRCALHDGAIIALHDAAERDDHEPAGVRALPAILDAVVRQHLEIVPLERWLEEGEDSQGGTEDTERR